MPFAALEALHCKTDNGDPHLTTPKQGLRFAHPFAVAKNGDFGLKESLPKVALKVAPRSSQLYRSSVPFLGFAISNDRSPYSFFRTFIPFVACPYYIENFSAVVRQ
jgi:hypothetical protein